MKRLEFVIILIRKGAIGVYSFATPAPQGARSQLKICADQTACPRRAPLSPEPLLAAEGRPSSGPPAPSEQAALGGALLSPGRGSWAPLLPLAARYGGQPAAERPP